MPTNRKKVKRERRKALNDAVLALLLFDQMFPPVLRKPWPDGTGWMQGVLLGCPGGRHRLRRIWFDNQDAVLDAWKATGRRGRCFAEREFGMEEKEDGDE